MGKALYRQYRPTSFDEVIGQDHITTTLKNSLSSGSIGHAYLLTGPHGVGKTSIARALAFAVNDLPYQKDGNHLDIIEIDAASNRRIDEIRSLRERVTIAPAMARYKVYIIDEVHMLTREAFNALLKTLEEPPAHVIFILATTEIHKLPDTIVSRCITFTLRPIDQTNLAKHLGYIAKAEKLSISKEAIELLATHGDGSFRDSISLLDQIKNVKDKIEAEDIELALGLASKEVVDAVLNAVSVGNPKSLTEALQLAYEHGASETNLSKQIAGQIRTELVEGAPRFSSAASLALLAELLNVPSSPKPRAKLELALLGQLFEASPITAVPPAEPKTVEPNQAAQAVPELTVTEASFTVDKEPAAAVNDTSPDTAVVQDFAAQVDNPEMAGGAPVEITVTPANDEDELWSDVLQKLKTQNNTLYGIARMAKAEKINNKLSLRFKFPFHFRQVNQAKNKTIITKIVESLGHTDVELLITQDTDAVKQPKQPADDKTLASITNIFGESEVLES